MRYKRAKNNFKMNRRTAIGVVITGFTTDGTACNTAENGFMNLIKKELPWIQNNICAGHTGNLPIKKVTEYFHILTTFENSLEIYLRF